jgi:hypothetical protein
MQNLFNDTNLKSYFLHLDVGGRKNTMIVSCFQKLKKKNSKDSTRLSSYDNDFVFNFQHLKLSIDYIIEKKIKKYSDK